MSSSSDPPRGFPPAPSRRFEPRPTSVAEAPAAEESETELSFDWRKNAVLFLLTLVSVFWAGRNWDPQQASWKFAVPLLAILITHEFGHYFAARIHRVPTSLPYFLPLPVLNPFGTLGAVILMPKRIRSARALLDIGAAGPLAGMIVAVPLMIWGLSMSRVEQLPVLSDDVFWTQEGQCLLYFALKALIFGHIPPGYDVILHPTAFAAWAGFFLTFLNLLPFGQLDGGHVAYALFGRKQNKLAAVMLFMPVAMLIYNFWRFALPAVKKAMSSGVSSLGTHDVLPLSSLPPWVMLLILMLVFRRLSGSDHPPVDDKHLSTSRQVIAAGTLALFIALFMPSPLVSF